LSKIKGGQKTMKKIWGIALAFLFVGGLLGYGIGMYQTQTAVSSAYQQGIAYQQSVTPTTPTGIPASLDITWDDDEFDHSATVDADGAVATDTDVFNTLTIENNDDTNTANNVYLMLWNPVSNKDGIDTDLQVEETYVFIEVGGLTKALYNNGDFTDGYLIGDLAPGDKVTIEVHITLQEANDDTYIDGETYDCDVYVYQPSINYADAVDFTVLT
jgi:hypothetical protein